MSARASFESGPNRRKPLRVLHSFTVDMSVQFIRGQAAWFASRDIAFEVVSSAGPFLTAAHEVEGMTIHEVPMSRRITPLADLVALWRLIGVIRRGQFDAMHGHTPKAGLLLTLAGWLCRVPIRIYHVHGIPWQSRTGLAGRLLRLSEWIACRASTHVLCVSHSAVHALVKNGMCAESKCTVPAGGSSNGIDSTQRFVPAPESVVRPEAARALRARYAIPDDAPVVGFVGRLARDKGIEPLADAWTKVRHANPNAHLLLVGPEDASDPVDASVLQRLRDDRSVHLHGVDWNTPPIYHAIDLLVLPTYREGFPNVLLEAGASGLAVVATDVDGCTDAVIDGVTGTLVPAGSAIPLADAITTYLNNSVLRGRHGTAGRDRAVRDFGRAAVWTGLYEAYQRCVQGTKPYAAVKRALDVVVAGGMLLTLSPLLLVLAIAVRFALGAPVLFRQQRPGLHSQPFTMVKFRTMRDAVDAHGRPLDDAQRLTRFGRLLRASSLDELPELWNVLRGEMSLVGPRPLLMEYLPRYSAEQRRRHDVRPGITGWAQVNGRNASSWDERFTNDVWYVEHQSLALDVHILLRTVRQVVIADGVSQPGHVTMPRFGEPAEMPR